MQYITVTVHRLGLRLYSAGLRWLSKGQGRKFYDLTVSERVRVVLFTDYAYSTVISLQVTVGRWMFAWFLSPKQELFHFPRGWGEIPAGWVQMEVLGLRGHHSVCGVNRRHWRRVLTRHQRREIAAERGY